MPYFCIILIILYNIFILEKLYLLNYILNLFSQNNIYYIIYLFWYYYINFRKKFRTLVKRVTRMSPTNLLQQQSPCFQWKLQWYLFTFKNHQRSCLCEPSHLQFATEKNGPVAVFEIIFDKNWVRSNKRLDLISFFYSLLIFSEFALKINTLAPILFTKNEINLLDRHK